jgi:hypothetical protein
VAAARRFALPLSPALVLGFSPQITGTKRARSFIPSSLFTNLSQPECPLGYTARSQPVLVTCLLAFIRLLVLPLSLRSVFREKPDHRLVDHDSQTGIRKRPGIFESSARGGAPIESLPQATGATARPLPFISGASPSGAAAVAAFLT